MIDLQLTNRCALRLEDGLIGDRVPAMAIRVVVETPNGPEPRTTIRVPTDRLGDFIRAIEEYRAIAGTGPGAYGW